MNYFSRSNAQRRELVRWLAAQCEGCLVRGEVHRAAACAKLAVITARQLQESRPGTAQGRGVGTRPHGSSFVSSENVF